MKAIFQTDRGQIRPKNEDSGGVFQKPGLSLAVVADGMGGHNAGDTASKMALQLIEKEWRKSERAGDQSPDRALRWLTAVVNKVNEEIFRYAQANPSCSGMGTTLVAALCTEKFCIIASIGDSRCYLQSEDRYLQVTDDHSFVNELVKSGEITKAAAEVHPKKNILTRALGTAETAAVDYRTVMFEEGDFLLLCSDGLSNKVTSSEMREILHQPFSLSEKAHTLIQLANDKGGEDNITVVIVEHCAERKSG